jgi:hypothetical protein
MKAAAIETPALMTRSNALMRPRTSGGTGNTSQSRAALHTGENAAVKYWKIIADNLSKPVGVGAASQASWHAVSAHAPAHVTRRGGLPFSHGKQALIARAAN